MTQVLANVSALSPGHQLWVVPEAAHSKWNQRIDWHLNFQITRTTRQQMPSTPETLNETLTAIEWQPPVFKAPDNSPIMIYSPHRVPARWVVVLPANEGRAAWMKRLRALWTKLKKPSLRVFLPAGLPASDAMAELKEFDEGVELAIVLDPEPKP